MEYQIEQLQAQNADLTNGINIYNDENQRLQDRFGAYSQLVKSLEAAVERLNRQLNAYKKTINQIDDYLEHAGESEIKRRIITHIGELTNELSKRGKS
jgi:septal ring factor EnvC (AmiA/AmiB activator)